MAYFSLLGGIKGLIYTVMVRDRRYTVASLDQIKHQIGIPPVLQTREKEGPKHPAISYKITREQRLICGYQAYKVLKLMDNEPVSELWLSPQLAQDIGQTCKYLSFKGIFREVAPVEGLTERQKTLIETGFPVKTVDLYEKEVIQVIKIEKNYLKDPIFKYPKGLGPHLTIKLKGGKKW